MALPTKVVEQLSRAPARTPGWSSRVLLFSATFFVLSCSIFLGIQYGYKPFLENQIIDLDKAIKRFENEVPENKRAEFILFYSQLENLDRLLASQSHMSRLFSWLEENTNTSVQLTSVTYNQAKQTLTLAGQAKSITNLGEQLNRFRDSSQAADVQLSQLAIDSKTGGWNFSLSLRLLPSVLAAPVEGSVIPESSEENTPADSSDALPPLIDDFGALPVTTTTESTP